MNAIAVTIAIRLASVPELQKRRYSIDGNRALTASASLTLAGVGEAITVPVSSASITAALITGSECPNNPAEYSPTKSTYVCPSMSCSSASMPLTIVKGNGSKYRTERVLPPGNAFTAFS